MSAHGRRGFFRELLRGASRAAGELDSFVRGASEAEEPILAPGQIAFEPHSTLAPTTPAPAAHRLATVAQLRGLCEDVGLAGWADEAAALARASFRLTLGGEGRSRLGGVAAQIALDELPPSMLPGQGTLLVSFELADRSAAGVEVVDAELTEPLQASRPVLASAELTLPAEPTSLPLDAYELDAWTDLRGRLAELQGVELEERSDRYHALHRLLGHPDDGAPEELDGSDWHLLFQLSSDDELGVAFGYGERLSIWIRDEHLRDGRFDDVRAFVR